MSTAEFIALLPLTILAASGVIVMLVVGFARRYQLTVILTLSGLAIAFISLPFSYANQPLEITPLLIIDGPAVFYMGLIFASSFVVVLLSNRYIEAYKGLREEYYVLILFAALGSAVLVASDHFASFFLGLETLSVALYALIAYPHRSEPARHRIEAGIKYLILAGATSAFMLFGMALIYTVLGTLEFSELVSSDVPVDLTRMLFVGWGMLIVGIGFKLALVPFHLWTPDVYQGAPAPVTGFIASVSKGGMFALMLRYFNLVSIHEITTVWTVFAAIAILSMLAGNILALLQNNVKRILAYSSISHLGYLMVAFLASGSFSQQAVAFYLVAYFATTLSAFGVITQLSEPAKETEELHEYSALFWRRPWLAIIFTVALISLAGIPPSIGLVGKIFLASAGVQSSLWFLLLVLVVASVIGVYYYMRVVITMFRRPEEVELPEFTLSAIPLANVEGVVLSVLALLVVGFGLYPAPVLSIIEKLIT